MSLLIREKQKSTEMESIELVQKSHSICFNAPEGEMVSIIYHVVIKYSKEICESKFSKKDIVKEAGIFTSYKIGIYKGVDLAC